MSTRRLMLTSSSLPMFSGSMMSLAASRIVPSVQSSMYMNERVCSPSPQISISCLPESLAAMTLRQLAAAVVGALGAVDVVIARDAGGDAVVLAVVAAHALAEQLLPAVAVFRQRR